MERRHNSRRVLESPTKYDAVPKATCLRCGLQVPYNETHADALDCIDQLRDLLAGRAYHGPKGSVGRKRRLR